MFKTSITTVGRYNSCFLTIRNKALKERDSYRVYLQKIPKSSQCIHMQSQKISPRITPMWISTPLILSGRSCDLRGTFSSSRSYSTTSGSTNATITETGDTILKDSYFSSAEIADSTISASPELSQQIMQIGDLKAMGLVNYTPVGALEAILEAIHVTTGLPWWATIAVTTVAIRLALLPLMISVTRNNARLLNINPLITKNMEAMRVAQVSGDKIAGAQIEQDTRDLFKQNNCSPFKSLKFAIVQGPLMLSFFLALRKMAQLPVPAMSTGGLAWFADLTVPDPYYILPILGTAGFFAIIEAGTETGTSSVQTKPMKNLMRLLGLFMLPFMANLPAAVLVYFVTSNAFSVSQIMTIRMPSVKKRFDIPDINPEVLEFMKRQQEAKKIEQAQKSAELLERIAAERRARKL